MPNRISSSWHLVKASWAVLKEDRRLLVFPILSSAAALVVIALFVIAAAVLGTPGETANRESTLASAGHFVFGFLLYLSLYFVIFFFNAALVAAVIDRLGGGGGTIRQGLQVAMSKVGMLLGYAAVAATVGMILRHIEERVGFVGRVVTTVLGATWTVATYLVVPVLVHQDIGPIDAVRQSAKVLKQTWGENIAGRVGLGLIFGAMQVVVISVLGFALVGLAASGVAMPSYVFALVVVLVIGGFTFSAVVYSTLSGIFSVILYRFAVKGIVSDGFAADDLRTAFASQTKAKVAKA